MINLGLVPEISEYKDYKLKMVGIFSKNREEWALLDMANMLYGNTMIPLYDTLGPQSIPFVLNQTNITTCFCSEPSVKTLMLTADLGKVKNIILLD